MARNSHLKFIKNREGGKRERERERDEGNGIFPKLSSQKKN